MTANDPKQAIIDFLSQSGGVVVSQPDPHESPVRKTSKWVSKGTIRRSGGMDAQASTITFLKEKDIPHRQVHAVTLEDAKGQQQHFICFVTQDAQGIWHFEMGGGGGLGGDCQDHPGRSHPWANLTVGGWEDRFWAGGEMYDDGFNVTQVQLIGSNGRIIEDTVDEIGFVLFVTDHKISVPVKIHFYNHAGDLVSQHKCFDF